MSRLLRNPERTNEVYFKRRKRRADEWSTHMAPPKDETDPHDEVASELVAEESSQRVG